MSKSKIKKGKSGIIGSAIVFLGKSEERKVDKSKRADGWERKKEAKEAMGLSGQGRGNNVCGETKMPYTRAPIFFQHSSLKLLIPL